MVQRKSTLSNRPSIFRKTDQEIPETEVQETVPAIHNPEPNKPQQEIEGEKELVTLERTTLYLHPSQSDKLDSIALAYKKRTGKRINRSDIIRRLIDKYSLDEPL